MRVVCIYIMSTNKMASTMDRAKDENEKSYKLIELLQKYPAIWDVKSKEFKDRDLKKKAFDEISKEMDWTFAQVTEKYKNLRTYYTKEKRKVDSSMKSGAGTSDIYRSKWEFFDALDAFLRDTLKVRAATSNLNPEQKDSDEEDDDTTEGERIVPQKRKKIRKEDELIVQALDILKSPAPSSTTQNEKESKDAVFASLIKSQLEDIPDGRKKEYLKLKIQQMIVEAKFEDDIPPPLPMGNYQFPNFRPVATMLSPPSQGYHNMLNSGTPSFSPTQSENRI